MINSRIIIELLIAFALAFAVTFTLRATGACAQQSRTSTFTDRNGYFAGSSITHGNKTDFYDARGRYQGTATQYPKSTNHPLTGEK